MSDDWMRDRYWPFRLGVDDEPARVVRTRLLATWAKERERRNALRIAKRELRQNWRSIAYPMFGLWLAILGLAVADWLFGWGLLR